MDYGQLLRDAWDIVWHNKFLLVLGFLAALGSGTGGSSNNISYNLNADEIPPNFGGQLDVFLAHVGPLLLGLLCLVVFVGVLMWLISLTGQAGLISAADRLQRGEKVTLGEALGAGLGKLGRMVGVYLALYGVFILLGIVIAVVALLTVGTAIGYEFSNAGSELEPLLASLGLGLACLVLLLCALIPFALIVTIILPFAQRAAVLEDMGVLDSLRRAWWVIRNNLGDVAILVVLFVVLGILYGIAVAVIMLPLLAFLFVPMLISVVMDGTLGATNVFGLVCGGLALGLLGAFLNAFWTSYRSTAMTLAYRQLVKS